MPTEVGIFMADFCEKGNVELPSLRKKSPRQPAQPHLPELDQWPAFTDGKPVKMGHHYGRQSEAARPKLCDSTYSLEATARSLRRVARSGLHDHES